MRAIPIVLFALAADPAASDFLLRQPIDCVLGETCYIQNYLDHNSAQGKAQDFRCGGLAYDGHMGTDFALPTLSDLENRVTVLAAASGVVTHIRDGVTDGGTDQFPAGQDCGNGVLITHEDGWETQYCHMRMGSVQVAPGERVEAGAALGEVGLSGNTQFPHVHLSVRKDGQPIDPFAPQGDDDCRVPNQTLWETPIDYVAGGLLTVGFSDVVPEFDDVQAGTAERSVLTQKADAIVLFGHAFGSRKGDILRLEISGPQGTFLTEDLVLDKQQAQVYRAAGRRLTLPNWPVGPYRGHVTMIRDGQAISRKSVTITVE
ncbi:M23 family metallopeptidase [Ruegeria lacuscaerulensis]|uniref:M23 family metallopeptidase n=1 Tax=Ruegeria lacuscaerulensis TaxID=55218 RepID=UPI00147986BC|nr:M23 family metallopeptidase [Ruegeria lacuscaerulensis]